MLYPVSPVISSPQSQLSRLNLYIPAGSHIYFMTLLMGILKAFLYSPVQESQGLILRSIKIVLKLHYILLNHPGKHFIPFGVVEITAGTSPEIPSSL